MLLPATSVRGSTDFAAGLPWSIVVMRFGQECYRIALNLTSAGRVRAPRAELLSLLEVMEQCDLAMWTSKTTALIGRRRFGATTSQVSVAGLLPLDGALRLIQAGRQRQQGSVPAGCASRPTSNVAA